MNICEKTIVKYIKIFEMEENDASLGVPDVLALGVPDVLSLDGQARPGGNLHIKE